MIKELVALALFVFLLSTVESHKQQKKVLSIVKDINNEMVTVDEIVDALTPIIKGSCSCCDDKPKCQGKGNFQFGKGQKGVSKAFFC